MALPEIALSALGLSPPMGGMGGIGNKLGSIFGGGNNIEQPPKPKESQSLLSKGVDALFGDDSKKFEKLEIEKLEIDSAKIGKLIIESMTEQKGDFEELEDSKLSEEGMQKTVPQSEEEGMQKTIPQEESESIIDPLQGISDTNNEVTEILGGSSATGGGVGDISFDTETISGQLGDIDNTLNKPEDPIDFALFEDLLGGDRGWIDQIVDGILKPFSMLWGTITDIAKGAWTVITDAVIGLWTGVTDIVSGAWTGIKDIASGVWEAGKDVMSGLDKSARAWAETSATIATEIAESVARIGIEIGQAISGELQAWADTMTDNLVKVTDQIGGFMQGVSEEGRGWMDSISGGISGIIHGEGDTTINMETGELISALEKSTEIIYGCLIDIKGILLDCCGMAPNLALEEEEPAAAIVEESTASEEAKMLESNAKLKAQEQESTSGLQGERNTSGAFTRPPQKRGPYPPSHPTMASGNNRERYTHVPPPMIAPSTRNLNEFATYQIIPQWQRMLG